MTEHIQIVRKLRPGESIPQYSVYALLYGVTFPVKIPHCKPNIGVIPQKVPMAVLYRRRCKDSHETITNMIRELKSNQDIADEIKVTRRAIFDYIHQEPDLLNLSHERTRKRNMRNLSVEDGVFIKRYGDCIGKIMELHEQGMNPSEISREMGICRSSVRQRIIERTGA